MSKDQFPTLLDKRATLLGPLTRIDLTIIGVTYLVLSWLKISGLYSLGIIILVLISLKFITKYFKKGFLSKINDPKKLSWSYKLGGFNE